MTKQLKLYIWTGFCVDYTDGSTDGLAFAIAWDEADARKQIVEIFQLEPWNWGELEICSVQHSIARCISGGS